jgi:predicted membrane-bound spermidine synthase
LSLRYRVTDAALQASVAARHAPAAGPAAAGVLSVRLLLVISFIEGGAVMVMELLGARIAAPYYGTSLYVWTSVLAVTLGALALGYFAGGWLSRRLPGEVTVFAVLLVAALLTAIAPSIAPPILLATDHLGVRLGAVAACLLYLLPPVACLGMVSPLITQLIDRRRDHAGESAGVVYAVSTVGGILATFLAGFYLLPEAGIVTTALLAGGLLGSVAIGYFYATRRPAPAVVAIILGMVVVLAAPSPVTETSRARVVYRSSGILGEWTVLDSRPPASRQADDQTIERRLLLNGIDQTYTQRGFEPLSLWHYPHKIAAAASVKPAGSKALLLGMGGGSIAFELKAMGFDLDIVELDERIGQIAAEFFRYDPGSSRLVNDDARRYLRATTETYDVVAIDLLIGEVQPTHVFSIEGFGDLKARLRPGALVIVNFQGFMDDGKASLGPRSIYKTMRAAGFHVNYSVGSSGPGATDIVYVASLEKQDYRSLMRDLRYNRWFTYDHIEYEDLISDAVPRLDDAYVLVDDRPRLELLNARAILDWRAGKLREHPRWMLRSGLPIYR